MLEKFFCQYLGHKDAIIRPNEFAMYYACVRCGRIKNQRDYDATIYEAERWLKYKESTGQTLEALQHDHVYREIVFDEVMKFLDSDGDPT